MSELSDAMEAKEKGRIEVYVPNDFNLWDEYDRVQYQVNVEKGFLMKMQAASKNVGSNFTAKDINAQKKKVEDLDGRLKDVKEALDSSSLKFSFKPILSFTGKEVRALAKDKAVARMADVLPLPPKMGADDNEFTEWIRRKEDLVLNEMENLFEWRRAYMYLDSITDQGDSGKVINFKDENSTDEKRTFIENMQDRQVLTLFDALDNVFTRQTSFEATVRSVDF